MTPYYDEDGVTIFNGDCLDLMRQLDDRFDLVFTSPPYNLKVMPWKPLGHWVDGQAKGGGGKWSGSDGRGGIEYEDHDDAMPWHEYERWQRDCLGVMWDHLTDTGAIFYNHKPRPCGERLWHPRCLVPDGLPVRQEIIWARAGGMNYNPTAYVPTYETVLVVARPEWRLKSKGAAGLGDIWRVNQESSDHPAPFPVGLPARAIETCAPRTVLDPFMGSATTLVAARQAGVRVVGIEKSERYCDMAVKRLRKTTVSLFAESPSVQNDLFAEQETT